MSLNALTSTNQVTPLILFLFTLTTTTGSDLKNKSLSWRLRLEQEMLSSTLEQGSPDEDAIQYTKAPALVMQRPFTTASSAKAPKNDLQVVLELKMA